MTAVENLNYQFVVVGGGMSGMIAAIAAARLGVRTALLQNRPVLGGNASSEIRLHICGADNHAHRPNARETGILEELLLENKWRNPSNSFDVFDLILWEKTHFQENLDLFLNCQMTDASSTGNHIEYVDAVQLTSERHLRFHADLFMDATGDGTLGVAVNANYRMGREASSEYGEAYAPPVADNCTMGNSIQFNTKNMGHPVPFVKPHWAYSYTEEDLNGRDHSDLSGGYWWIELGGDGKLDVIKDAESIRDELLKVAMGVWDHIKNGGGHGADNLALDWIGFLPGKRESRRFLGDYVLTANDILNNRPFADAIAYGGWPMDVHVVGGISTSQDDPTTYYHFDDVYQIPYRCLYSRNIDNLFIGGRLISATHIAFGSTRVMATCSIVGQAIGIAASIAERHGLTPRGVGENHIYELQQEALKEDLYIPHISNSDPLDKAREARVTASSQSSKKTEPDNVNNGVSRTVHSTLNYWEAKTNGEEWLRLDFPGKVALKRINIRFDSNLCEEIMPSLLATRRALQEQHVQSSLVKDFDVQLIESGKVVETKTVSDNYLRNIWVDLDGRICDSMRINLHSTNGCDKHRMFEVRCYE